ncbi:glycosyltransferase family 2 protein [Parasphingopyxis marina]|uniref:Glycosyltransferase family 2 protein n=1 Tax=Parasphingopyxis marina TaxID=2761622 RepID=A0A842HYC8_9SPHN|nr:glycosyltransferase family 2 protein [Parasphingopyxis marina]MBC2777457.1 glycosyltransferase family 2 protein [Parasphingopyxis marina]
MTKQPKLVMTLLVRDEEDIVGQVLRYHLAAGVDHIIVTDNGSVDGTLDILTDFERAGALTLLREPGRNFAQGSWVTRMALMARDEYGADWILNGDADEFWLADQGDLKTALPASGEATALDCPVRNMLRGHDDDRLAPWWETMTARVARPVPFEKGMDRLHGALPAPFFYMQLGSKALVRAEGLTRVWQGNHGADHDGREADRKPGAVTVYHYPVRSRRQFWRNIRCQGAGYARNAQVGALMGWQKRRWYRMLCEDGDSARAIADALPGSRQLQADLERGVAIRDDRPARLFSAMGILDSKPPGTACHGPDSPVYAPLPRHVPPGGVVGMET